MQQRWRQWLPDAIADGIEPCKAVLHMRRVFVSGWARELKEWLDNANRPTREPAMSNEPFTLAELEDDPLVRRIVWAAAADIVRVMLTHPGFERDKDIINVFEAAALVAAEHMGYQPFPRRPLSPPPPFDELVQIGVDIDTGQVVAPESARESLYRWIRGVLSACLNGAGVTRP